MHRKGGFFVRLAGHGDPQGEWENFGPLPKDEQDPGYVDETYPGHLMYVPCGRHHDQGESWTEVYKQEVWYFDWVLKRKGVV